MGCFNRVIVDGIACIDFYVTTKRFHPLRWIKSSLDGARLGPRPPFSTYSLLSSDMKNEPEIVRAVIPLSWAVCSVSTRGSEHSLFAVTTRAGRLRWG
jgi:hypothetical protein